MPTKYPSQIDNNSTIPIAVDNRTPINASSVNVLREAIIKIETELGTTPKSTYGSVSARLDQLESVLNTSQTISLAGDLGGTEASPKVIGLQGRAVSSTLPTLNQVIAWNGSLWAPTSVSSIVSFSNDISGTLSSQTVVGIRNNPIINSTPNNKDVLQYKDGYSGWIASHLDINDILFPTITISSTNYVEVGQSITPVLTLSYNFVPTSVTYSDSDGNATTSIISPYTTYTSPYTYTKSTYGSSVTITIIASDGNIDVTETFEIKWVQKAYYGLNASTTLSESFIESLSDSILYYDISELSNLAINISSGYWHFAIRSIHEDLFFSFNKVNGGVTKVGQVSVTNAYSFTENYTLYKTDNTSLGECFIEIETSNYTYS